MNLPSNNLLPVSNPYDSQLHALLAAGDWDGLHRLASDWLKNEPDQPIATFIQNMACLYVNPPAIIQNKRYLETVKNKDWKVVLGWWSGFQTESDRHNPYFQCLNFIVQPGVKKKQSIESALLEHPNHAELLFLQAISLSDRGVSIEKLKQAIADKPSFSAALYLLGIFSLQINHVQEAETYLKQAVDMAPDFLEANYQLGSLYTLYIPDSAEQARIYFGKVMELDPQGGAGMDAKKVLESHSQPQYGQRIGSGAGGRRGGMSIFTILGIALLTVALFAGPVADLFKIQNNITMGVMAGIFVFIGLYSAMGRRGKQ